MPNPTVELLPLLRQSGAAVEHRACGIRLDIGRQRISGPDFERLVAFGEKREILAAHRRMMAGAIVNESEGRAALHTSLRSFSPSAPHYDEVEHERRRIFRFAEDVRSGRWLGCRADRITDIINVGIGGSEMGPHAVYHALRGPNPDIRVHFLSSVDGVLLERILASCQPHSTLAIVSSKSFSTRETQVNAAAVDQWFLDAGIVGAVIP